MTALAANIRMLADRYHGGSVRAAAMEMGVPQPTLAQLVEGITPSPRVRTLHRIAEYYGTTIDWLLTGAGDAPDADRIRAKQLAHDMQALIARYGESAVWQAAMRHAFPSRQGDQVVPVDAVDAVDSQ